MAEKHKTKCSHPLEINFDARIIKYTIGRLYNAMLNPFERLRTNTEHAYKNIIALEPGRKDLPYWIRYRSQSIQASQVWNQRSPEKAIEKRQDPISHEQEDQRNNIWL